MTNLVTCSVHARILTCPLSPCFYSSLPWFFVQPRFIVSFQWAPYESRNSTIQFHHSFPLSVRGFTKKLVISYPYIAFNFTVEINVRLKHSYNLLEAVALEGLFVRRYYKMLYPYVIDSCFFFNPRGKLFHSYFIQCDSHTYNNVIQWLPLHNAPSRS